MTGAIFVCPEILSAAPIASAFPDQESEAAAAASASAWSVSGVSPLTPTLFIISSCDSFDPFKATRELLMLCDVDIPSRCIFLAEAAIIRQRRKRLGTRVETLNTKPERI
jgi:hypothetical protein